MSAAEWIGLLWLVWLAVMVIGFPAVVIYLAIEEHVAEGRDNG
jgi:hypothetical protein